ncbi:hypothetical protein NIES2107_45570 [Nostoc carneum NIES-2107]|nr:hypothetical protein NIES2107_45570 [Nostoc carneum NIES-2107]
MDNIVMTIMLTGGGHKAYINIRLAFENWDTLIKKDSDPEVEMNAMFNGQAVDYSKFTIDDAGNMVLNSTNVYAVGKEPKRASSLMITLQGCNLNTKSGDSGKVTTSGEVLAEPADVRLKYSRPNPYSSQSENFKFPSDLAWRCIAR